MMRGRTRDQGRFRRRLIETDTVAGRTLSETRRKIGETDARSGGLVARWLRSVESDNSGAATLNPTVRAAVDAECRCRMRS
jgi:hypothetical protein